MKTARSALSFLRPKLLGKIDKYLLLNYPRVWTTKIHYVLFYGLLANAVSILFFFIFFQPSQIGSFSKLAWYFFIPEALIFIYWFYLQFLFYIDDDYGDISYSTGMLEVILYLACTIIIFSVPFVTFTMLTHKIARDLNLNEKTVCAGPMVLNFYSRENLSLLKEELNYDGIQKALIMAEDVVKKGTVEDNNSYGSPSVHIENAILFPETEFTYGVGNWDFELSQNDILIMQDGEAELIVNEGGTGITIKRETTMITLESEETANIKKGDAITPTTDSGFISPHAYITIIVKKGALIFGSEAKREMSDGEAMIMRDKDKLFLLEGEDVVEGEFIVGKVVDTVFGDDAIYEGIAKNNGSSLETLLSIPHTSYEYALSGDPYRICFELRLFMTDRKSYLQGWYTENCVNCGDYFRYNYFTFWQTAIIILGIFLLLIVRYGEWRSAALASIFVLIEVPVISWVIFALFGSMDYIYFFERFPVFGLIVYFSPVVIGLPLFVWLQIMWFKKIIRTKKYKFFAFLRVISLPVEVATIVFILDVTYLGSDESIRSAVRAVFLVFLLCSPIQRKFLIYLMSLPKG